MTKIEEIQIKIRENLDDLQKFKVKTLFVFGSVAKGTATNGSDIDFLVEFSEPVGLFDFLDVKYFLEDLFKSEIDLATHKALHPKLKDDILKEAIRVA